jgi:hypothetical protein
MIKIRALENLIFLTNKMNLKRIWIIYKMKLNAIMKINKRKMKIKYLMELTFKFNTIN